MADTTSTLRFMDAGFTKSLLAEVAKVLGPVLPVLESMAASHQTTNNGHPRTDKNDFGKKTNVKVRQGVKQVTAAALGVPASAITSTGRYAIPAGFKARQGFRVCYRCADALVAEGRLQPGQDPPEETFHRHVPALPGNKNVLIGCPRE